MEIKPAKIMESLGRGFIEGMGIDSALWITSAYIPQLAQPSPIPIPGWHPPEQGTHWDDLLGIAIYGSVIALGAIKRDINIITEGVSMIAGAYILSQHQPAAVPIASAPASIRTSQFSDLVKVD